MFFAPMNYHRASTIAVSSIWPNQRVMCSLRRRMHLKSRRIRSPTIADHQRPSKRLGLGTMRRFERGEIPVFEDLITPQKVPLEKHPNVEFEGVSSNLTRQFISNILDQFARKEHIRELAAEHNITSKIFDKAFQSFRIHCCFSKEHVKVMDPGLKIVFSDIQNQDQSVDSLYPYFLKHANKVFPHLECINELRKMSDLTQPHNWYPQAREIHRKIVFHAGPTNSGKTYEALQVLKNAPSGMYCGPLRLLAYEVYERINKDGIACDMITGERRLYAHGSADYPAEHCAFTVEMMSVADQREVCVIDEIQMLRDNYRGASWTRALLGAAVKEIHLCGEEAAVEIVQRLLDPIGEHVDVRRYQRKGDLLVINTHGLRDLSNVEDGDCIIHFSKAGILKMAKDLKSQHQRDAAIVFGDLPPETKKEQIVRFNDPNDSHKVLLATDAVGMGMNLNIRRIIFTTLQDMRGEIYPAYFIKQIAGRAGRFASLYCTGKVMTMNDTDAKLLGRLMAETIPPIDKAAIAPSFEMFEMFSMLMPNCSFVELIDIFVSIATVTDDFFVSMPSQIRDLAILIEHIPLSLKDRWTFCICPVGKGNQPMLQTTFVKMIHRYSQGNAIPIQWIRPLVEPYLKPVDTMEKLKSLIEAYDILYCYLWLAYRFEDYFIHIEQVRDLQMECVEFINASIRLMMMDKTSEKEQIKMREAKTPTLNELLTRSSGKELSKKFENEQKPKRNTQEFERGFSQLISMLKKKESNKINDN